MKYQSDPLFRKRVKRVIDQWDPIDLLNWGAPDNEYDHEIDGITVALQKTSNAEELSLAIKDIFIRAFDEKIFHRDLSQCQIIAERIFADNIQINIGDWIRTWKPGVWRIERIIDFFYECRSSLSSPKVETYSPLVIAERLLDGNGAKSFEVEAFHAVLTMPLSAEEMKQLSGHINDKSEMDAFDRCRKNIDLRWSLCFSVGNDAREYFHVLIDNLLSCEIKKGMTSDEVLAVVEKKPVSQFLNGQPTNKRIQFVCNNYELRNAEFVYRSYQILDQKEQVSL